MAEVDRSGLLQRLLAASAAVVPREGELQSTCFVLRAGWAYSLSHALGLACACPTGLDASFSGAVEAQTLIKLLRHRTEEKIDLSVSNGSGAKTLKVSGRACGVSELPVDDRVLLRIDDVERPVGWVALDTNFAAAVALVSPCTNKKEEPTKACVHVHPDYVEASDNRHFARYRVKTFVKAGSLVRASVLTEIVPLGFVQACETPLWLHFRNKTGLRMSVRKYGAAAEKYPDHDPLLKIRGRRIEIPQALAAAALRAGVVADPDAEGPKVTVELSEEGTVVTGLGVRGRHVEGRPAAGFRGPPVRFKLPAELLAKLTEQKGAVEVTNISLRVDDGPFSYLSSLEVVNGQEAAERGSVKSPGGGQGEAGDEAPAEDYGSDVPF